MNEIFESILVYEKKVFEEVSSIGLLIDGINDFDTFFNLYHEIVNLKVNNIIKVQESMHFISIKANIKFFKNNIYPKLLPYHYNFYSIFSKESLFCSEYYKPSNIQSEYYYLYSKNSASELNRFIFTKNVKDIKSVSLFPIKYLYGFDNFSDLLQFYTEIIQNQNNWPVLVLLPNQSNSIQKSDSHKTDQIILNNSFFPHFKPLKILYYFSFVEKNRPNPKRIFNSLEIYTIKDVKDTQISHLYEKNRETNVRTFLGFETKFRCYHAFDYFINKSDSNFVYDIKLMNDNQFLVNDLIKHDMYFISIKSIFDSSILFSINNIDCFNFDDFSTFFSFDKHDDFLEAKKIFKLFLNGRITIKNLCSFDDDDEYKILFPNKKIKKKNLFYIMFRIKLFGKSKISKQDQQNLLSIINGNALYLDDMICSLDNKKYIIVGFQNEQKRNKVLEDLDHSKYSIIFNCYNSEKEISLTGQSNKITKNNPIFTPKPNMFYIYFQEYPKSKLNKSSIKIRPLFGVKNIADLQRNFFLCNDPKEYTFIGFSTQEHLQAAINDSLHRKNALLTNAFNGTIINFQNNKKNDFMNGNGINKSNNSNQSNKQISTAVTKSINNDELKCNNNNNSSNNNNNISNNNNNSSNNNNNTSNNNNNISNNNNNTSNNSNNISNNNNNSSNNNNNTSNNSNNISNNNNNTSNNNNSNNNNISNNNLNINDISSKNSVSSKTNIRKSIDNKNNDNQNSKDDMKENKLKNENSNSSGITFDNLIVDLNNYKRIQGNPIGHGSYGVVYLVENIHTHKKYAAKVKTKDQKTYEDFIQEISFYSKFIFPLILSLHGYSNTDFQNKNSPTMLLDFMENGSLDKFFQDARKSQKTRKIFQEKRYNILLGITIAMFYLHEEGVVHRDLKPGNILLDEKFYPRVSDFGSSIMYSERDQKKKQTERAGFPMYMAPEIFLDKDPYSYKVDVYSFAMVAYELYTCVEPFSEKNYKNSRHLIKDVLDGVRPDLSIISDVEIQLFFRQCWSSEPSERPFFHTILQTIQTNKFIYAFQGNENEAHRLIYWGFQNSDQPGFNINLIKKEAYQGNPEQMFFYASSLYYLFDKKEEAFKLMEKAAEKGHARAIYYVGIFFVDTKIQSNLIKSNYYFKKASDLGCSDAMINLGNNYEDGVGTKVDYKKATEYYKKAADLNNAKGLFNYGLSLFYGKGIKKNQKEAAKYFQMAADLGNVKGMFQYGCMRNFGYGIEKNFKLAEFYYRKAISYGYSDAMINLSSMMDEGYIQYDPIESLKLVKTAADLGNDLGMLKYGSLLVRKALTESYDKNEDILKILKKAAKYLKGSADQGNADAAEMYQGLMIHILDKNGNNSNIVEKIKRLNSCPLFYSEYGLMPINFQTLTYIGKFQTILNQFVQNRNGNNIEYDYHDDHQPTKKSINDIKINRYQSFQFMPFPFIFISHNTISQKIRDEIDINIKSLPFFYQKKSNLCFNFDQNDIFTFYFFILQNNKKDPYLQMKEYHEIINQTLIKIMKKYHIQCILPDNFTQSSCHIENGIYLNESMLSKELLESILCILQANENVVEIKRNIFDGIQIATYIITKSRMQNSIIGLIKDFLLPYNNLFNSSEYPLQNNIIINEEIILQDKNDFDIIVKEIETLGIKPIKVERDKLYLYEYSKMKKLFQKFSFICFKNEIEKMEVVNHINSILFKGMKNVLKYDIDLHYASFDNHNFPKIINDEHLKIFKSSKGIKDIQQYVISFESIIDKIYIGFDSTKHRRKCHYKFYDRLHILASCPAPKFFVRNKKLHYFCIKSDLPEKCNQISKFVSSFACDKQLNCTDIKYKNEDDFKIVYVSYLGYNTENEIQKAFSILKEKSVQNKNDISIYVYKEGQDAITQIFEPKEAYLFYGFL